MIPQDVKYKPYEDPLKTVNGIFDGEVFWGEDNKIYPVPPNYASKSKLVEGDALRLYMQKNGVFVFKQITLVDRSTAIGIVANTNQVSVDGKYYKVLPCSLTYFKALPGDEAVISFPKNGNPTWAAVQNIIKPDRRNEEL